ncbi:putative cell wall glucanase [Podospora aff. communis PSN243]|uniref:Cell wall glucanase n=1 Tax=Podospora aff. communis PSN243 TaxID=3040156 RepID=A0AAV9GA85_9PEZI|nr:putative cell wall glucanase [Podospora aff. communis PSN243]
MKIWHIAGVGLFGYGVAAQMAEVVHGHMRLPGMMIKDKDGKKVIMVENAAATDREVPGVIVYVDNKSSVLRTTTEMVRIRPYAKAKPTGVHMHRPDAAAIASHRLRVKPEATQQAQAQAPSDNKEAAGPNGPGAPSKSPPGPRPDWAPKANPPVSPDANLTAAATGVTYSPYNADGSCRSADQINADFQRLATQQSPPYSIVRIYGVDCDQVARVMPAADAIGVKLFLGVFNLDDLTSQINTLITAVSSSSRGWSAIDTVSVGNELVNNGQATAQQAINAMNAARTTLRSAGYTGPVVTVDTFLAVERNPSLCDESDYCAINVHPFFDADTPAEQAGDFVLRKVRDVRSILKDRDQKVVVTESGWPWQGNANGKAVPGRDNQRVAVRSIVDVYAAENPGGLFLFTAFDDPWKKPEAWTFYTEQFWGMDVAQ